MGFEEEEEVAGRCAAILANGKRCPNASLPSSRYCGLPAHQELEHQEGDNLGPDPADGDAQSAPAEEVPVADGPPIAAGPTGDEADAGSPEEPA